MRRKRFWIMGLVLALVLAGVVSRPTYAATVIVNSTTDVNDGDTSSIANLIADPGADGVISLREAIQAANNTPGSDTIEFNILGCGGLCTIQPASALPALNAGDTTIDGYSQIGAGPGVLRIEIDGSGAGNAHGFSINSAGNVIQGLVINRFSHSGIRLETSDATNNTIAGNFIGLAADGTTDLGNGWDGVYIYGGAQNNTIGGDTYEERNIISGNEIFGIFISGSGTMNNIVSGNYIGTDVSGTADRGNGWSGIYITSGAQNNTIGGDIEGERNLISGNDQYGVRIEGSDTTGNTVSGNYIGTDAFGIADRGNSHDGVYIHNGAQNNTIGGDTEGKRNLISGNDQNGVCIEGSGTMSNTIAGNYIGTDANGTVELGNTYNGVSISNGAQNNTIGGDIEGERNLISDNDQNGVRIEGSGTMNNIVSGNYIGLNVYAFDHGNGENGVYISDGAQNNTIGGDTDGERNIISGNDRNGVRIEGSDTTGNTVSGNTIGLAADGTTERGNSYNGVFIYLSAQSNTIGGDTPGKGNFISGNDRRGVYIYGSDTMSNTVSGNIIGLAANGTANRGNGYSGVFISGNAQNNTIGGDTADERNVISGNDRDGVRISGSFTTGNVVSGNYIGLTAGGTSVAGNDQNGVYLYGSTKNNTIGGDTDGERNVISGNGQNGIHLDGNGTTNNTVSGNYIGPYEDGISGTGNSGNGVHIGLGPHTNTIGGDADGERNVISGNAGSGVYIVGDDNTVSGNYIGTDYDGTDSLANREHGIYITNGGQNNTIGGDASGERNVISGNDDSGVCISGSGTTNNTVSGNYIGINADSTSELPNRDHGVYIIDSAQNNTIGGDTAGERNVISGNLWDGVRIEGSGTMSNTVSGNTIGLAADGTTGLGNENDGVYITNGAQNNTIGGDTAGEGNVISGNDFFGVRIEGSGTTGNTVSGNTLGLATDGTTDRGNSRDGVSIYGGAENNTVGGDTDGERNVISGNEWNGVRICDSDTMSNTVSGNYIGTDANGTDALGNTLDGVRISDGAQNNTVGGDTDGERNVISGNQNGVVILGSSTTGNTVSGNYIGLATNGTGALGNIEYGVQIQGGAQNNTVGPGNVIAHNGNDGVEVYGGSTSGNIITQNSIFSNDMGIDLMFNANGDIAAPVIVTTTVGSVNIVGTACAGCTVEVFENSDTDGEGETYVGDTTATTSGAFTVTVSSLSDPYLTATATDATDGTSEFSVVFTATVPVGRNVYLPIILKNH